MLISLYEMVYLTFLVALAVFTLLDALITAVGMRIGCIELNPLVATWGVQFWVIFRILLLGCMLTVFFFGHQFLLKHSPMGTRILKTTLISLDFYIATVVFSGLSAICLKLLL